MDEVASTPDSAAKKAPNDPVQRGLLLVPLAVGTAYVAGYVARSSYLAEMGLGFFTDSREALIGTGVGLIVNSLPVVFTFWWWGVYLPLTKRKVLGAFFGILGYFIICGILLAITNLTMLRDDFGESWQGEMLMALTVLPGFGVLWILGLLPIASCLVAPKERVERLAFFAFAFLVLFVPYAFVYGKYVLPFSNSTFGGLVLEEVTVWYKDSPSEVKRLLVDSDDKVAILGVNLSRREYLNPLHQARPDQSVERVAWDEIAAIRRPPVNRVGR